MNRTPLIFISIGILILGGIFGFWLWNKNAEESMTETGTDNGYCTQEAKLCPDGSYVGRMLPSCEFAACPESGSGVEEANLELKLNQTGNVLGVRITPLEVMEDSRCPIDVVCIWAGQVVVRARLESGLGTALQLFTSNTPITTEAETVELIATQPAPTSGEKIAPGDYVFTFTVKKRTADGDASKG
jgi:hypothetical protein